MEVGAHGPVVGVFDHMHPRHRQAVLVDRAVVQADAVVGARQVLAVQQDAGQVVVLLQEAGVVAAPAGRVGHHGQRRQAQRGGLHQIAAGKAPLGPVPLFVEHGAGRGDAAMHVDRPVEHTERQGAHMAHVMAAHLARCVGQPVGELRRRRVEQQARRFDGVAGDAHHARLLQVVGAVPVGVEHAGHPAAPVVHHLQRHALGAQVEPAGVLRLGDLGMQRRPFGGHLAALVAETELHAGRAAVAEGAVDGQPVVADVPVADPFRTVVQHLVVVGRRMAGDAMGAGYAQLVLRAGVVGVQVVQRDRPVQQAGAVDVAIDRAGGEFVRLDAEAQAVPVHRRAADRLDRPGGLVGGQARGRPVAGGHPLVQPAQLLEGGQLVVVEVVDVEARAGFQHHHIDAALAQLVGHRAAAGAGADNHHHRVVGQLKARHGTSRP